MAHRRALDEAGGDWDLVFRVAMWGVAGGIVGARFYHVVTSWSEVPDPKWQGVFEIWKGGLGIWGAIAGGVIAGAIVVRRSGNSIYRFMDVAAPGILLAQAIGRWGNYFNQELFGKPTSLPWGLEIDVQNRPEKYIAEPTFHPLFLYESLWNFSESGSCFSSTGASRSGRRASSPSTSPGTRRFAPTRRPCASTRRTSTSGCG